MKKFTAIFAVASLLAISPITFAAAHGGAAKDVPDAKMAQTESADMTDGEIRKVDVENKKITIKHGTIKHLEMPGMTMVFNAKDKALLDKVQVGDKVSFMVVSEGGKMVVTAIEPAK